MTQRPSAQRPQWHGFKEAEYAAEPNSDFQQRIRKDNNKLVTQHYTPLYDDKTMEWYGSFTILPGQTIDVQQIY
jgi:hypothetical protein